MAFVILCGYCYGLVLAEKFDELLQESRISNNFVHYSMRINGC